MKELRVNNSTKDGAQYGPTTAKQPKIEPGRNHLPCMALKATNRQKTVRCFYHICSITQRAATKRNTNHSMIACASDSI